MALARVQPGQRGQEVSDRHGPLASEPSSQVSGGGRERVIAVGTSGVRGTRVRPEEGDLPHLFLVLVAAVTLGGLLLRLPLFGDSMFSDELSTYYIVNGHSLGRVLQLVHSNQETSPPLYFVLAWAVKGLLGNVAESIRLVSLVTGTAAIPLTFLLGLWTVGRRAALVGATCVALAPFMIFFSTDARPFMLALFFALLSTLTMLRALDTGRLVWWAAYAASSCAAASTHYTVVFLLVVQLGWALWTQPRARMYLVLANVAAAGGLPPMAGGPARRPPRTEQSNWPPRHVRITSKLSSRTGRSGVTSSRSTSYPASWHLCSQGRPWLSGW